MPTIKQHKAAKLFSENLRNGENSSMGEILKEAGYSDTVAEKPKVVTSTKGWQELMDEYFPDSQIAELHKEILNKKEFTTLPSGEVINQPHRDSVRALDLLYKVKGKYSAVKFQISEEENEIRNMSDEELENRIQEYQNRIRD